MADQKYKITDYDLIDELQPDDSLLVARLSEYKYYKLTWSIIKEKLDAKANAVNTATIGTFGLAKVNEQGIVTDIKVLTDTDIPELPISKITDLQDNLDAKADKTFASYTSNFVIGSTSTAISSGTVVIDQKEIATTTVTLTKTFVNPSTNGNKTETVDISSKDGSIQFEKNNDGDILLSVDIDNCQKQADWTQADNTKVDYIKNKPTLATVATSGSYNDLSNNPTFISGDDSTLTIEKAQDSNQYTFTGLVKGEWGKIIGTLSDQTDLSSKFAEYYTSAQVDSIIAEINQGLLKVKGYISEADPLDYIPELSEGILWLQSSTGGAPSGSTFICNKLVIPEEPAEPYWDNTYRYEAKNFDVWINKNESGDEKSYFWLESEWEQLDFTIDLTPYAKKEELSRVAFSGSYNDLSNKPTYATVATTGSYNDLEDKPTIPAAQIQSDWTQENDQSVDYIKNKPTYATVATTGSYNDLIDKPTIPEAQVQSDWDEVDPGQKSYILNKPDIVSNINIQEQKILLFNEDFDPVNKYFVMSEMPNSAYSVDLYWNGIFLNENLDYFGLYVPTTAIEPQDIVIDNNLGKVLISTVNYVKSDNPEVQTNWELSFNNDYKIISSVEDKRIYILKNYNDEESGEESGSTYELVEELYTSLEGITYAEFLQHSQWVFRSDCIIDDFRGNVDVEILGSVPVAVIYIPDGPEVGDTEDVFTLVIKTAELS